MINLVIIRTCTMRGQMQVEDRDRFCTPHCLTTFREASRYDDLTPYTYVDGAVCYLN